MNVLVFNYANAAFPLSLQRRQQECSKYLSWRRCRVCFLSRFWDQGSWVLSRLLSALEKKLHECDEIEHQMLEMPIDSRACQFWVRTCVRQILLGFIFVNCFSWVLLNRSLLVCVGVAENLHQFMTVVLIAVIQQWFRLCMKRFYRPWNDSRGSTVYSDVDDQGPSSWVGLSLVHYPVFSGLYFKCSRIHRYIH